MELTFNEKLRRTLLIGSIGSGAYLSISHGALGNTGREREAWFDPEQNASVGSSEAEGQAFPSGALVDVGMHGAVGDGVTDDTRAIQSALDTGRCVVFPSDKYRITDTLRLRSQRVIGLGSVASRAQTLLVCEGNFPAFEINDDNWQGFSIDGFFLDFGEATPTDAVDSGRKCGFRFSGKRVWPEQISIRNCTVRGAWYGFYDDTGTYMSLFERVEARHCRVGFYKRFGTTISFINCFSRGDGISSRQGFVLQNILSPTLVSCAADQMVPEPDDTGSAANYFADLTGLSIIGWDGEGNRIGGNCAYMKFDRCTADVRGFTGYQNALEALAPDETYLIWSRASNITFSGSSGISESDLVYKGDSAVAITLLANEGSEVHVQSAVIRAPVHPVLEASFAIAGRGGAVVQSASTVLGSTIGAARLGFETADPIAPGARVGSLGLFMNTSGASIAYGGIVSGEILLPAAASGARTGGTAPMGNWLCLGEAAAYPVDKRELSGCVSLFQRIS